MINMPVYTTIDDYIKKDSAYTALIRQIAQQNKWGSPTDWYEVNQKMIQSIDREALRPYNGSAIGFVMDNIQYPYKVFLFKHKPQGYWRREGRVNIGHAREYVDWLCETKGYTQHDDMYKLVVRDFKENGGGGLLDVYDCCVWKVLQSCYPEVVWYPWLFNQTVSGVWNDPANHVKFIEYAEGKLGITAQEDWYRFDSRKVWELPGGQGFLANHYSGSLKRLLRLKYPELKSYKFERTENGYWKDPKNVQAYLQDLFNHLGYTNMEDWYKVGRQDFQDFHGGGLIDGRHPYWGVITENIQYEWEPRKFIKRAYSKRACAVLDELSRQLGVPIRHAQNHPDGEFRIKGTRYSADGFIEEHGLVVEYHGCIYHGCIQCYPDRDMEAAFGGRKQETYDDLFEKTTQRTTIIRELGYRVVEIWGCSDLNDATIEIKKMIMRV